LRQRHLKGQPGPKVINRNKSLRHKIQNKNNLKQRTSHLKPIQNRTQIDIKIIWLKAALIREIVFGQKEVSELVFSECYYEELGAERLNKDVLE
jgi:hypothetical protein